eukprot:TRINITY_DN1544_c0_g1_i2.p1 TRINITY_DN1544_c0_g1~~TRINITY_DN1544_c0_g1_i2.p1  ORF type:complete len:263 (-),score=44.29 TRINITY_DN1544_c0_g1_i2:65-853(-)
MHILSLEDILQYYKHFMRYKSMSGVLPFAASMVSYNHKWYSVVLNPTTHPTLNDTECNDLVVSGSVIEEGGFFPLADSFHTLLKHYIKKLECDHYTIVDGSINLFPRKDIPVAITQNVKIEASPLFIHERSVPGKHYMWAYSIRISMDSNVSKTYECQLSMRHWDITDGSGQLETVDGPGVIGQTPKISPGTVFSYESCCPLRTTTGSMGGHFRMRKLSSGQEFDAIVPTFQFSIPDKIEECDVDSDNEDDEEEEKKDEMID